MIDVAAGAQFSCALRVEGSAFCWGANYVGQLGDGTNTPSAVAVPVSGNHTFTDVAIGNTTACGLTTSGQLYCWGQNSSGLLGPSLAGLPFSNVPVLTSGGLTFRSISMGLSTVCGIAADDLSYCWGSNSMGQFGNGVTGGDSTVPVLNTSSGALGFTSIHSGFFANCAQGQAGIYCWGQANTLGNGSTSNALVATPTLAAGGANYALIDTGIFNSCGLSSAGDAFCWGYQFSGELANGTTTGSSPTPTTVQGGLRFTTIDLNSHNSFIGSTCGVVPAGGAWCWGSNQFGQLGAPSAEVCTSGSTNYACSSAPLEVSGGLTFTSVSVGMTHACGATPGREVYCWGANNNGQLGDGTTTNSTAPVRVLGL
ncbi:MAG TPA: hypothetical protein VJ820_19745 [Propionibacteriaceae bacterium]|nr:hypothetical protein [Propionibacteriaceae bacterium]